MVARQLLHHLCRVDIFKQRTRALVEHVGVEALGLEQRHAALPDGTVSLEHVRLDGELLREPRAGVSGAKVTA